MTKPRTSHTLSLILVVAAAILAASTVSPRSDASPATATGAYAVSFQVKTPTTVPDGATITCKARLTPRLTGVERVLAAPTPIESHPGQATVSGSAATCNVQMPFAFAADTRNGASLSYEIDAFTAAGPVFLRTQQGIPVALPAAGSTANVLLDVNL